MNNEIVSTYIVTFDLKFSERDSFESGCYGETETTFLDDPIVITAANLESLLLKVRKHFNVDKNSLLLNSCDEVGRLDVQTYTKSKSGNKCTYNKNKGGFKKGAFDLWLHCFTGEVTVVGVVDLENY